MESWENCVCGHSRELHDVEGEKYCTGSNYVEFPFKPESATRQYACTCLVFTQRYIVENITCRDIENTFE